MKKISVDIFHIARRAIVARNTRRNIQQIR